MECEKAGLSMMKYMDNTLDKADEALLLKHCESCDSCRADYELYTEIIGEFTLPVECAPDNFEELVMERIRALPSEVKKYASAMDSMICVAWGIFSILFGLGFIAVINKEAILAYLSENPSFSIYSDIAVSVSAFADRFSAAFTEAANTLATSVSGYLSSSRYILLLIIAVLVLVQYAVYKKNKVEA